MEITLKRTFGGVPTLLLNFGELPPEAKATEGDIDAIRSDFRGEDTGGEITVVIPWRQVKQGAYFVSVVNAWEPPEVSLHMGRRIETNDCNLNFRLALHFDSVAYDIRWRRRKVQLLKEISSIKSELGELTQAIEQQQQAWLKDLQIIASMLQPVQKHEGRTV